MSNIITAAGAKPWLFAWNSSSTTCTNNVWTKATMPNSLGNVEGDTSFWDTTNRRILIPAGVSRIRINAQLAYISNATGLRGCAIYKSGTFNKRGFGRVVVSAASATTSYVQCILPHFEVAENDYFEPYGYQTSGGNLNITTGFAATWVYMEVLE